MNDLFQALMHKATRLTRAGQLSEATALIRRALGGAAGAPAPAAPAPPVSPEVLEGCVFEVVDAPAAEALYLDPKPGGRPPVHVDVEAEAEAEAEADADADAPAGPGAFSAGSHTGAGLTRRYKLYLPPAAGGPARGRRPLVVMLHGCAQDPDDFAAGTGMNERAREQGFLVLYPAQSQDANPQRCWNWFKHNHQQRGSGEPALLASLTQAVMQEHDVDPERVYLAGLSAGGAMAAIVAASYPELFAAVGVHSGLAQGAASDLAGALAAMQGGPAVAGSKSRLHRGARPSAAAMQPEGAVPTIVFHGDLDQTVHPRNGEQVIATAVSAASAGDGLPDAAGNPAGNPRVEPGLSVNGRRYTRSTHYRAGDATLAEHWLVHGAGHAWSGGDSSGSYTDPAGPDATREMLRFFFEHPRRHR